MTKVTTPSFKNGDLKNDFQNHLEADEIKIDVDGHMGADGEVWYIDVNDTGYFYYNESDRDSDLKKLYKAISK